MPLHILDDHRLWFPPVDEAMEDGLLAMGGSVTPERVVYAYKNGIFPWYDGDLPLWWSPNPRFVLLPQELKISKSMRSVLRNNSFRFTINKSFTQVINQCKLINRKEQDGTWINNEVQNTYIELHKAGIAHSAEAYHNGQLVGGLYGVIIGKVFFGESMFSHKSNASKFAFINYVQQLQKQGIELIDCQVYTEHLESLGAKMIMRQQYLQLLQALL